VGRSLRILFAGLALPYPPTNGHRLRTWAMVRALAEEGHEITLVAFAEPEAFHADLTPLRVVCRAIELVPLPSSKSVGRETLDRLRAIASPAPYAVGRLRARSFTRALELQLTRGSFDALICDGIYNVQNLPREVSTPVLLNKDDVAHVILERYVHLERNPLRRLYAILEARKVRRWEAKTCSRMSSVLACSEVDRAILQRLCSEATIFVVPNVVDTDRYVPGGDQDSRTVLFQGGLDWYPNRDAVAFFVEGILPELRRLVPGAKFRVAGRSGSNAFFARFSRVPNVELTGTVPDMRSEIARATVCAVPLRIGSGTRLKILEAGAMGKAIVSTALGAEGLSFADGEEILIANEPSAFARALAGLLQDEERRRTMGRAARLRVEKDYSLPVLKDALRGALAGRQW